MVESLRASARRITTMEDKAEERENQGRTQPRAAVFADSQAMKEKLHASLAKPQYNVNNFYWEDGLFQYVAKHQMFENITLGVISLNAIYISLDTDYNLANSLLTAAASFQMAEHFFTVYFSLEWFVRFKAFKDKRDCLKDAWFNFDSLMVFMMVTENWVMTFIFIFIGGGGANMGNAGMMRLLRLLRLSRMARMVRLLRAMPELLILIKGMLTAMRSVFFTLLLQGLLLYVFGISFKMLAADNEDLEKWFPTVPDAMGTLLIKGTMLDDLSEIDEDLTNAGFIFWCVFYVFVLFSALTILNMLIGVLCEVISVVAAVEHESLSVTYVVSRVQEILKSSGLDTDGDGLISKVEFHNLLANVEGTRILHEVGVDVFSLVELTDFIFEAEGQRDAQGLPMEKDLTFSEVIEVILKLRSSNACTVKDIVDFRKSTIAQNSSLDAHFSHFEDKLGKVVPLTARASASAEQGATPPEVVEASPARSQSPVPPSTAAVEHLQPELDRLTRLRQHVNAEVQRIQESLELAEREAENEHHMASQGVTATRNVGQGAALAAAEELRQQLQHECTRAEKMTETLVTGEAEKLLEAQPLLSSAAPSGGQKRDTSSPSPSVTVKATVNVSVEVSVS